MIATIGTPEIVLILVAALLLFGAKKLPEVGRSIGRAFREFRRSSAEIQEEIMREPEERAELTKNCPKCDIPVPENALFCPHCGSVIDTSARQCPQCGKVVKAHFAFCPDCGTKIEKEEEA